MLRRVLQLVSFVSLAGLALFYPLIESLDGFDSQVPASDFEIELIVMLTFVGIMFVLGHLVALVAVSLLMQVLQYLRSRMRAAFEIPVLAFSPQLTPSPPVPLRI
jgi:hypothetical protein